MSISKGYHRNNQRLENKMTTLKKYLQPISYGILAGLIITLFIITLYLSQVVIDNEHEISSLRYEINNDMISDIRYEYDQNVRISRLEETTVAQENKPKLFITFTRVPMAPACEQGWIAPDGTTWISPEAYIDELHKEYRKVCKW